MGLLKAKNKNVTTHEIAKAMTKQSSYYVTHDMVTPLNVQDPSMTVFAAQVDDTTVLCWVKLDGTFIVKTQAW